MTSINQAIFSYPDGTGAMALSEHHYKLVAFAQQFAMRTGAKVEGIARRHDVCGVRCGRLHYRLCPKCDKPDDAFAQQFVMARTLKRTSILQSKMGDINEEGSRQMQEQYGDPVTKTSPLVPIPSPVDRGKVLG